MSYHINGDEGLITLRLSGELDLVETRSLVKSLLEHPEYNPDLPQLVDCRGVEPAPDVEEGALNELTSFLLEHYRPNVNASIAIVVDGNLGKEPTAAIYWLSCGLESAELFDNYDQALRWLMKREFYQNSVGQLLQ